MTSITVSPNPAGPGERITVCIEPWPETLDDCEVKVRQEFDDGHDEKFIMLATRERPCFTIKVPNEPENPCIEIVISAPDSGAIPIVVPID